MTDLPSQPKKKMGFLKKLIVGFFAFFVLMVVIGVVSGNKDSNTNTSTTTQNTTATTPTTNTATALSQHKVMPGDIHGTTRQVIVIVQPDVTKQQLIDLNDSLKGTYSSGLTHLTIEYFDNETIASDYFQKIVNASTTEADKMFVHYRATYTLNQTSGLNKLEWNEPPASASLPAGVDNNNWVTLKTY